MIIPVNDPTSDSTSSTFLAAEKVYDPAGRTLESAPTVNAYGIWIRMACLCPNAALTTQHMKRAKAIMPVTDAPRVFTCFIRNHLLFFCESSVGNASHPLLPGGPD